MSTSRYIEKNWWDQVSCGPGPRTMSLHALR